MHRAWVIVVIVVGAALGVAIAGVPTRHQDPPLRVAAAPTSVPPTTAVPRTTTTTVPAHASRSDVGVVVINAGGIGGKGGELTARLRAAGYATFSPVNDNTDRPSRSVVVYQPGYAGDAAAMTSVVGVGPVQALADAPISARWMGDANVMVVVGTDLR